MRKKIFKTKYLLFIVLISIIFFPAFSANGAGLVPCGGPEEPRCNVCFLFKLLENVMTFLVNTVGVVATLFLVIGGSVLIFSGANKGLYETGKNIITNTIIGTVIVLIAWIGLNTILTIAGFTRVNIGLNGNWFELQCSTAPGLIIPPGEIPPGEILPPGQSPATCTPCDTASGGWNTKECKTAILAAAPALNFSGNKEALIKAIIWQESKANLKAERTEPDGRVSCGPMQVLVGNKSCAQLQDKINAVAYGVDYLNTRAIVEAQPYMNRYKKVNGSDFVLLELIAAAYNGGGGALAESADCGPGKNCDRDGLIRFQNPVPKWYCIYDFSKSCGLNAGPGSYENLRTVYVPNIVAAYNKYNTPQCQNQ